MLHHWKVTLSMLVTEFGIVISVKEQPENAPSPMLVTLLGISIEAK